MGAWVNSLAESLSGQVVAFDGKALRGALARAFGRTPLHQVHAWVGSQRLMLAQRNVEGAPEEGDAIVSMLEALELKAAIVTMDAGHASKKVAQKVLDAEAEYVVTIKANRKKFHTALREFFTDAEATGFAGGTVRHQQTRERGHGRDERRDIWFVPARALGDMATYWPGLQSIVMIRRTRVLPDATVQQWTHYYVSSLPPARSPARGLRPRALGRRERSASDPRRADGRGRLPHPRHERGDQLRALAADGTDPDPARRDGKARDEGEAEDGRLGRRLPLSRAHPRNRVKSIDIGTVALPLHHGNQRCTDSPPSVNQKRVLSS
jgi:predicted transposase YbfD/YdcC